MNDESTAISNDVDNFATTSIPEPEIVVESADDGNDDIDNTNIDVTERDIDIATSKDVESTESNDNGDDEIVNVDEIQTGSPEEFDFSHDNEISKDNEELEVNNLNASPAI